MNDVPILVNTLALYLFPFFHLLLLLLLCVIANVITYIIECFLLLILSMHNAQCVKPYAELVIE